MSLRNSNYSPVVASEAKQSRMPDLPGLLRFARNDGKRNEFMNRDVFVVDGIRTPFLKVRSHPGPFSASDLAVYAGRELLLRQPFSPTDLDEVIVGCITPSPDE